MRGVSPMVVPHLSLHSLSGTVSQALHSHGLNFGVSSGPEHVAEGLFAAVTILSEASLPGLWLVLTGWDSIPVPDEEGRCVPSGGSWPICRGIALALHRCGTDPTKPRLHVRTTGSELAVDAGARLASAGSHSPGTGDLPGLAAFLTGEAGRSWSCPVNATGWIELTGTVPTTRTEAAA